MRGVKNGEIPGGRCAVIRHKGSHDNLDESIYGVYREWLPESGEEIRDYPCFFHYINLIHEVDECDLLTDIFSAKVISALPRSRQSTLENSGHHTDATVAATFTWPNAG